MLSSLLDAQSHGGGLLAAGAGRSGLGHKFKGTLVAEQVVAAGDQGRFDAGVVANQADLRDR